MNMRIIAVGILVLLLAACGGGDDRARSSNSSGAETGTTTSTVTALPDESVCDVFSKDDVSRIIGMTVTAADNVDLLAGAQPSICNYYVDEDKVAGVGIQWMTVEDALWDDQVAAINTAPNPDPADMETVRARVKGLGDDAIKEVAMYNGEKTVGYMVLLKDRGMVLYVSNTAGVPDSAQIELVEMVIQAVAKL